MSNIFWFLNFYGQNTFVIASLYKTVRVQKV